jgi:hypothetical protein
MVKSKKEMEMQTNPMPKSKITKRNSFRDPTSGKLYHHSEVTGKTEWLTGIRIPNGFSAGQKMSATTLSGDTIDVIIPQGYTEGDTMHVNDAGHVYDEPLYRGQLIKDAKKLQTEEKNSSSLQAVADEADKNAAVVCHAVAMYDFDGSKSNGRNISFKAGAIIEVTEMDIESYPQTDGWWHGKVKGGTMWGAFPLTYVHCVLKRTVLLNNKKLVKDYLLMPSGWVVHNAEGDKAKIGTYNPIEKTMTSPTGVVENWSTSRLVGNRQDKTKNVQTKKNKKKKKGRALGASKENSEVMITVEAKLAEKQDRFFYDDEDDDDPEQTLYLASWPNAGICCCLGTDSQSSSNGNGVEMVDNTVHDVKPFKIQVTDSHVIYTTRNKLLWWLPLWAPCFGGCPQVNTKTSRIDGLNAVIVREDADAGCMGMFLMYLVWFLFGIVGGHYWYKKKRFAQTRKHKWFLFFYMFTLGGFGLFWLFDGFRIGNWVGGYTVIFHGEEEEDTWEIQFKSSNIAHAIRDSLYKIMAKERQLNPFGEDCVSSETCVDQLNKAPAERTIVGMNKKDKIVVSDDRVLFLKHKRDGIMNEWVEVFTKDVKALEINTPGQWPTWYAVMWYFPPWGLCGFHRQILGAPRCGVTMCLYRLTLGGFGILYIADAFIMCCCIDKLRMRSELKIVVKDGADLDLSMKLDKKTDGDKFRTLLHSQLQRDPHMSKSSKNLQVHHIQMKCPFECCKKREEFTERDTSINALSFSVHRVHQDKPKKAKIPPSLCCPICWIPCIKCFFCCSWCMVAATDETVHEVYHSHATKTTDVSSSPNSGFAKLLKIWCIAGLCGGHWFQSRKIKRGLVFIFLWFLFILMILWLIVAGTMQAVCVEGINGGSGVSGSTSGGSGGASVSISGGSTDVSGGSSGVSGYTIGSNCNSDSDCASDSCLFDRCTCAANYYEETVNENNQCSACDGGRSSPAGSTDVSQCRSAFGYSCSINSECVSGSCLSYTCACAANYYEDNYQCSACDAGLNSPTGSTSSSDCTNPNDQIGMYKERTSGNCGDSGGGWGKITSAAACGAGAAALGWGDTTATTQDRNYSPGCYISNALYFNTRSSSTYTCGSNEICLCTLTCQPGTYQDESGQTSCKTCPSGKSQPSSGKNYCQTDRRLSNTKLNSVGDGPSIVGDGPSIVKPQSIQNEPPSATVKEIPKIENEKISTNLKSPIQQSTDEICEAWLAEKQDKNVTNKWPFHRFALEQRHVVRSLAGHLESAEQYAGASGESGESGGGSRASPKATGESGTSARAGDKCTPAEVDTTKTCQLEVLYNGDYCDYYQATIDCYPACYCDDPAADDAIKSIEDTVKNLGDTCTFQCKSKSSSTGASSSSSSGTGTNGVPLACAIYDTSVPSQWMGLIIGLLVALWLKDLLILRSLLDSTTIELKSTLDIVPTEWSEPWACYLNTEDEAKTANELLRGFGRSYSRKPKLRVLKI